MNLALWFFQVALAALFLASGIMKALNSKEAIVASGQTGVSHFSVPFIRFVAVCEIFGALGLILPWLIGTWRILTPVAAVCLGVLMLGAAGAHSQLVRENRGDSSRRRQELRSVGVNALVLASCLFVAFGRFGAGEPKVAPRDQAISMPVRAAASMPSTRG